MVVVAAGRDEGGLVAEPAGELEAEHALVERQGAVEVGDLEVDVADVRARVETRRVKPGCFGLVGVESSSHCLLRRIGGEGSGPARLSQAPASASASRSRSAAVSSSRSAAESQPANCCATPAARAGAAAAATCRPSPVRPA